MTPWYRRYSWWAAGGGGLVIVVAILLAFGLVALVGSIL